MQIDGIHHITAIASDPQRNLDFYTRVLGLRLVKLTVNFDATHTYHFYLADGEGHPGTILTFFPWPRSRQGELGTGQAGALAFSIPPEAIGYWSDRLKIEGVNSLDHFDRFGEQGLLFQDPDGMAVELIATQTAGAVDVAAWIGSPVPDPMSLRGFHSVTVFEKNPGATADVLERVMGFQKTVEIGDRTRFEARSGQPGRIIDVVAMPDGQVGRMGSGIIHHVAWRALDESQQLAWMDRLMAEGLETTSVIDRQYFQSIYFHEPGGVLFEIATDPPGFTIDEEIDCLGTSLKLPPWIEPHRDEIMRYLPRLKLPVLCP